MSKINNLLKTIGRVFIETTIENLEENNDLKKREEEEDIEENANIFNNNLVSRSSVPVKENIDGDLYGSVYKSDGKTLFLDNGENNNNNYPLYYGSIVDQDGNWVLKNLKDKPIGLKVDQIEGGLKGGVSGLIKSYSQDTTSVETGIVGNYQTVLDPGVFYSEDLDTSSDYTRTAKYWGDVWSNNFKQ
jgi:hypothetical protein